jgi:hypothetical protein
MASNNNQQPSQNFRSTPLYQAIHQYSQTLTTEQLQAGYIAAIRENIEILMTLSCLMPAVEFQQLLRSSPSEIQAAYQQLHHQ